MTSNSQENLMAAAAAQMQLQQQQQQQDRRGSNTLTRKGSGIPMFQSPIKAGNNHSQITFLHHCLCIVIDSLLLADSNANLQTYPCMPPDISRKNVEAAKIFIVYDFNLFQLQ